MQSPSMSCRPLGIGLVRRMFLLFVWGPMLTTSPSPHTLLVLQQNISDEMNIFHLDAPVLSINSHVSNITHFITPT